MYKSIEFKEFVCESAEMLESELRDAKWNEQYGISCFLLLWGPPGAKQEEIYKVLGAVPKNIPVIGASTHISIAENAVHREHWSATLIESAYITPHVAYSHVSMTNGSKHRTDVPACINNLVDMFAVPEYFTDGKEMGELRLGAHGVTYNRPAYLLIFLPGTGASSSYDWPATDLDYQIVEGLSSRACRNLSIYGGSAAMGWPPANQKKSWVAVRLQDGQSFVMHDGVVGMLVETDLSFGFGNAHGFHIIPAQSYRVDEIDEKSIVSERRELPYSPPMRAHIITHLISPKNAKHPFGVLDNLKKNTPPPVLGPVLEQDSTWHTLVTYENDEVFPNPPYSCADDHSPDHYQFLRPVPEGSTLYHAQVEYDPVLKAASTAIQDAENSGKVQFPEAYLVMDCQGRIALLGEKEGPERELDVILAQVNPTDTNKYPTPKVFGMYGDGETCPSSRGVNTHWNWTVAALAFGSDFNVQYKAAAKYTLLGEIDRELGAATELTELKRILKRLVEVATILTQTDCCQIRTLTEDGQALELADGCGTYFAIAKEELDITQTSPLQAMITWEAFNEQKSIVISGEEYMKRMQARSFDYSLLSQKSTHGRMTSVDEKKEIIESIKWWSSIPICDNSDRPLGMLNIDSLDARYLDSDKKKEEFLSIAAAIASRAARPIRSSMRRLALVSALMEASKAENQKELAQAIVRQGAQLLGRKAYLSLMLPGEYDGSSALVCIDCTGPTSISIENVYVKIGPAISQADKGICGWVFENNRKQCFDNARFEADGGEGKPSFRQCIPKVVANYVVPVQDPDGGAPLGVLNAEAEKDVLDQNIHVSILERLADACAFAIKRYEYEARLWGHLSMLLPTAVYERLKVKRGIGLESFAPPKRKIVTMLYADIRGYTPMSQIIGEDRLFDFIIEYYQMLSNIIGESGGTLDKFMGDGVIAFYGNFSTDAAEEEANEESVLHSIQAAVSAGLEIADRFRAMAAAWLPRWRKECPEVRLNHPFELGVVIHTGQPIVGLFQTAPGTHGHLTYTAIGRDVNLAARIGGVVRENSVWITLTTWERLKEKPNCKIEEQPVEFDLPGIPHIIQGLRISAY